VNIASILAARFGNVIRPDIFRNVEHPTLLAGSTTPFPSRGWARPSGFKPRQTMHVRVRVGGQLNRVREQERNRKQAGRATVAATLRMLAGYP
jgi:hypothetical protein